MTSPPRTTFAVLLTLSLTAAPAALEPAAAGAALGTPARAAGRPYLPTEWTSRLRALLDPGPGGLAGGLRLRTVTVDPPEGTYRSARGEWVVRIYAPDQPEAARAQWRGERVAVVIARTDLPEAASGRALQSLVRLLRDRERGWGWLRRAPDAAQASPSEPPDTLLGRAERALVLGDRAGALAAARAAAQGPGRSLAASLHAARLLLRAGATEEGRLLAARTADRATRALASQRTLRGKSSLMAALAAARALAGQVSAALAAGRPATSSRWACATAHVARDLALAGAEPPGAARGAEHDGARQWLGRVLTRDRRCAAAYLEAYDLAVEEGDDAKAAQAAEAAATEARGAPLSVVIAAAQALRAGHPADAAAKARAALEADPTTPRAAEVLALAALDGGDAEAATRPPFSVPRATATLRAVGCLVRGDGACAAAALDQGGRPGRRAPLDTLALRAAAVALGGPGEAPLARAWERTPRSVLTRIAEALSAPRGEARQAATRAAVALTRTRYGQATAARLEDWLRAQRQPHDQHTSAATGSAPDAHGGGAGAGVGWLALASLLSILGAVALTSRHPKPTPHASEDHEEVPPKDA